MPPEGAGVRVANGGGAKSLGGISVDRADTSSMVGEIQGADLYEAAPTGSTLKAAKASHFRDVSEQLLADHKDRPKTRVVLQVVARLLGLNIARCLSNLILYISGRAWLEARRDYAVLPSSAVLKNGQGESLLIDGKEITAQGLAERFKPNILTISEDQSIDENARPVEIRYEVLPPRQGKENYALVYYIRRPSEHAPIPVIGLLLDLIRPIFWATKSEWNAIEISIDRESGEPTTMNYEGSNYTGDPLSFEMTSSNDVHLPVKVVCRDKQWNHTLHQKDGRAKAHDIENPFEKSTHPSFAVVNWSGGLDLATSAQLLGYDTAEKVKNKKTTLYPMPDLPLKFLDIDTYRKEALDLRSQWLKRRQTGHCYLHFPPRKDPGKFKVVNLISEQLPSLIAPSEAVAH
jgi:hypothetical protein